MVTMYFRSLRGSISRSRFVAEDRAQKPQPVLAPQRASLARLKDAAATAADKLKSTCLSELPTTPPARLAAVSDRINAMLQAVRTVRTALNEFYGSLGDEHSWALCRVRLAFIGVDPQLDCTIERHRCDVRLPTEHLCRVNAAHRMVARIPC
jgi:hypothetical protein